MPVDLVTGQKRPTAAESANTSFTQTQVQGPQTTRTTGQNVTTQNQNVSNLQSTYALNTTPEILQALQDTILQMTDRPAISDAEANAKFPKAVLAYDRKVGHYWVAPNGQTFYNSADAQKFNDSQEAKKVQFQASGGVIQGGTVEQRQASAERQTEIKRNREQQGKYSPEAAKTTAEGLSGYFSRILSEQALPAITRGAEASGVSQGTTRALLAEQAVQRVSENAAKVGADLSVQYGQLWNQLAPVLEKLTANDPNSITNQLIQAIATSKGLQQTGSTAQLTTGQTTTTQNIDQTQEAAPVTTITDKNYDTGTPNYTVTPPAVDPYQPSPYAGTLYVQADQPAGKGRNAGQSDQNSYYGGSEQFFYM